MIDIIIPAYNCAETISRTLHSVLAQSSNMFVCTVVDDCSTDDTAQVVSMFPEVRYIKTPKNVGCGMARQYGIDHTDCEYFMFVDSDDMIMPHAVEVIINTAKELPDIIQTGVVEGKKDCLVTHRTMPTWCHGKAYRREFVEKYGIRNREDVRWADDSYFNSICFELADNVKTVNTPTAYYTFNQDSVTRKEDAERSANVIRDFLNAMMWSCEFVSRFKDHISHMDTTRKVIEHIAEDEKTSACDVELCRELIERYGGGTM